MLDREPVRRAHHLGDPVARKRDAVDAGRGDLRRELGMVRRLKNLHRHGRVGRQEGAHDKDVQGKERRARP